MIHSYFVEILTVGLFVAFYFNWAKIYVHAKLWVRAFVRNHIADRVDSDMDLDFTPAAKVQPTGRKIGEPIQDPDNKFIMTVQLDDINFTYRMPAQHKNSPIR